jgi:uncharacterized protein
MTMRRSTTVLLLLFATGCGLFGRGAKSNFFSLDRVAPAKPPVAGVRATPVAIEVVELPPGLDRREMVVRKADQQLDIRNADQWTATLEPMVLHTLAFDLAARLPEGSVILPGETRPAVVRTIDVVFEEIAAGPESRVVLDGRWILREAGRADISHHERIEVPISSLAGAQVAAGMSQALGQLADRIAAALGGR